jgi:hypothetical protein
MAGILFSGAVKGRLTLRYGPLSSGCPVEDWREAEALRIGEARDWLMMNEQAYQWSGTPSCWTWDYSSLLVLQSNGW